MTLKNLAILLVSALILAAPAFAQTYRFTGSIPLVTAIDSNGFRYSAETAGVPSTLPINYRILTRRGRAFLFNSANMAFPCKIMRTGWTCVFPNSQIALASGESCTLTVTSLTLPQFSRGRARVIGSYDYNCPAFVLATRYDGFVRMR